MQDLRNKETSSSQNENKCFKEVTSSLRRNNLNKNILAPLYNNSVRNKFSFLSDEAAENVDVFMISETKIDDKLPPSQFVITAYADSYRLDRKCNGGGILLYIREDAPSRLIEINHFAQCFLESFNSRKKKWF